ncbi:hypothetical protein V490_01858 [Pseudogymnoascus sp. VKM F-3557]|nr:hypothetical protein V490_01858 [Pseudogymnoascus sp. VKM F-3557]
MNYVVSTLLYVALHPTIKRDAIDFHFRLPHMDQSANCLHSLADGDDTRTPKKRPRPVISCFECRKKKLKCDRLLPCHQCKKSGRTARCAYAAQENSPEPEGHDSMSMRKKARPDNPNHQEVEQGPERGDITASVENGINTLITTGIVADVEALKERVAQLERMLLKNGCSRTPGRQNAEDQTTPQPNVLQDPVLPADNRQKSIIGMLFTKGHRSQYHALDQKLPMLSRFEEAMQVLVGLSKEPAVAFVMKEIKSARKLQAAKGKSVENLPLDNLSSISAAMRATLLPRHVCERLSVVYFTSSERLLKILHRPTFLRDCEAFWNREQELPRASHTFVDDAVLPQLVGVILIASSLSDIESLSVDALSIEFMYDMLKSWVNALDSKRRLQLSTIQTQCLLLVARQMRASEAEQLENDSAALVRSAINMGLHRDPREFPKISSFEGEIRRRIWMTIVELDMQISYTSGGRPMVRDGDFSTSLASKFEDDEIFEGLTDLPLFPVTTTKDPLGLDIDRHFYAILGSHIEHRLKAFDFANKAHRFVTSGEALEQGRQLEAIRDSLRDKLKNFTISRIGSLKLREGDILNSILVYVYTLRPLLSIYRQHCFHGPENSAIRIMEETCVESSMDILSFLDLLRSTQYGVDHRSSSFNVFHALCKADIMQAALTICHAAQGMDRASSARRSYWCISRDRTWSRADLIDRVYTTVNSLVYRKHEPIHDIRNPLCLAVVAQYLLHIDNPRLKDARMRLGAYNAINAYLESLRQSTAKSFFNDKFSFELGFTSPLTGDGNVPKPNETIQLNEEDLSQDAILGSSEFNLDTFLDFSFSGDWDWQQGWL